MAFLNEKFEKEFELLNKSIGKKKSKEVQKRIKELSEKETIPIFSNPVTYVVTIAISVIIHFIFSSDFGTSIFTGGIITLIIMGMGNLGIQNENANSKLLLHCKKIAFYYRKELATKKMQSTYTDSYGQPVETRWIEKEIPYFIETQIMPTLEKAELITMGTFHFKNNLIEMINFVADEVNNNLKHSIDFDNSMSGLEYESFCKKLLEKGGWTVEKTKSTGDQGVDLIAKRDSKTIAIQCKKSSRAIGNKAIQEIYSGMSFYNINYGFVISNASYTEPAKRLATKNNITLLHHNDILNNKLLELVKHIK